MLLTKKADCPTCGRKVVKSDLMLVETTIKTRVTCCPDCIKYLKIRKIIKDDKNIITKNKDSNESEDLNSENYESIYKSHLKAKNIDVLKKSKELEDNLPDAREIEKRALEEQKIKDKVLERKKEEDLTDDKIDSKEETKDDYEDKKQTTSDLVSIETKKTNIEEKENFSSNQNISKKDNYFSKDKEINNRYEDNINDKIQASSVELKENSLGKDQIVGSTEDADRISETIAKKQKERGFKVTASDWMVTSNPMIDKISSAIERKQKERLQKGYIKIDGSEVIKLEETKKSEKNVKPIQKDAEELRKEKTIEEKVDEKIGGIEDKKPYQAPGTEVKKILKIRCPTCTKEFSIEKSSGTIHLKCPNCGEEGTVEL